MSTSVLNYFSHFSCVQLFHDLMDRGARWTTVHRLQESARIEATEQASFV